MKYAILAVILFASPTFADSKDCEHAKTVQDNYTLVATAVAKAVPACISSHTLECQTILALSQEFARITDQDLLWYLSSTTREACKD